MSMEESISLEETNKIRISLGLKPLTDDGAPADSGEKQAEENYANQREAENKQRESKRIQDRIAKVKNRRELNTSLKGITLGDHDGDDDTLRWVKKSKKREKELAKKRQEELENMDKVFQGDEYTERDLVGLKVSHDFEDMDEGEARILTLKDSRILDNEEDELQNVEMAEDERTKRNKELKIKKRDYTGYDDEEFVPGQEGMKRSVLSKYDEELNGIQETGFRLGSSVQSKATKVEEQKHAAAATVNKSLLTIDYAKTFADTDYLKEGDVGFKKPKTKKKRSSRRVPEGDAMQGDGMDIDQKPIIMRARDLDANFVDDDELQAALARSRKVKLHKATKMSAEQLAKKLAAQRAQEEAEAAGIVKVEEDEKADGLDGLTFDDTSEFIRAVGNNPIAVRQEPTEPSVVKQDPKELSQSRDVSMAPGDEAIEELEAGEVEMKEEEDEQDDAAILDAIEDLLTSVEAEQAVSNQSAAAQDDIGGTASEQTFKSGLAGTVNILRQQGLLAKGSEDQQDRENTQTARDRWLAQQRRAIERRETEKWQSRGQAKDQATREMLNRQREQQEVRETVEMYKNYKPDVNLVYYDNHGRAMTPKEAWKALSHRFHGKGSGKMKTEKHLKKINEEKKQAAMSSGDTPLSMTKAFQQRQEKTGQAHMVLSVGNRGTVPQAAEFFDTHPLSKGKSERGEKGKKKGKVAAEPAQTGFMTLPAPQMQSMLASANASPVPSSGVNSSSPAPKPGFSRISSAVDSPSQTGADDGERSKVTIGFGTKRKAAEEAQGSPPAKRR